MVQRYNENGLIFIYIDAFIIFKVEDLFFTDLFCIFNILWTYYFTFYISFNWLSFPFMMLAGRKFNFHYGISHMLSINFFFSSFHVHELLYLIWWYFVKRGLYFEHSFPWNIIDVFRKCLDFHEWMKNYDTKSSKKIILYLYV